MKVFSFVLLVLLMAIIWIYCSSENICQKIKFRFPQIPFVVLLGGIVYAMLLRFLPFFYFRATALILVTIWILVLAFLNRKELGVVIFGAGSLSNSLAVISNGLRMPILPEAAERIGVDLVPPSFYVALTEETFLPFLADRFSLPDGEIISVGDMLIALGLLVLLVRFVPLYIQETHDVGN